MSKGHVHPSSHPSIHPLSHFHLSNHPSVHPNNICLSTHFHPYIYSLIPFHLPIHPSTNLNINPSVHSPSPFLPSIQPTICPSRYFHPSFPSICLSFYPSIHPSTDSLPSINPLIFYIHTTIQSSVHPYTYVHPPIFSAHICLTYYVPKKPSSRFSSLRKFLEVGI